MVCCHVLQAREVQELRSRLTAADSANLILARQEREAYEQAQAARAEAQRARDALTPANVQIRCVSAGSCRVSMPICWAMWVVSLLAMPACQHTCSLARLFLSSRARMYVIGRWLATALKSCACQLSCCNRSDLQLQVDRARREKLLADQRADRFEKQATQLSQKYQAVDLDVYNSLQQEHTSLTQQLAQSEARVSQLQQQVEEQQKGAKAKYSKAVEQLSQLQVSLRLLLSV